MSELPDSRTQVHVLTGFLGSGKTTLLKALLADPALAETAVVINEFGEIALDHLLVREVSEGAVVLRNGCVCCSIRTDLQETLRDLQAKRAEGAFPPFARVILETTGLADPMPIVATLLADPVLRHQFRLGTVVATVDAVNGLSQLDTQPESVKQAAIADRLVLTKTDLLADGAGQERLDVLRRRLEQINATAPIMQAVQGVGISHEIFGADLSHAEGRRQEISHWLAAESRIRSHDQPPHAHAHDHEGAVRSFSLRFSEPMDWTVFGVWLTMLLHRHGDRILRVKGLLNIAGADAPVVVHGVQQIVHAPVHLDAWPDACLESRLVFIVDGLDPALIERSLRAFLRLGQQPAASAA